MLYQYETQIKNDNGDPVVLNEMEYKAANYAQQVCNSLGYEIDITTLTAITKRVVEQKFFEVAPADYLPVRVGEGAWSTELLTYRDFSTGGGFEDGIVNTAAGRSRFSEMDGGVDAIKVQVINWAKQIVWSLFDIQHAQRAGNWDIITSKERSRKKNWDLGIQEVAFVGLQGNTSVKGLLTQSDVTANTALITKKISAMTDAEFEALLAGLLPAYRANSNRTTMPTHFIIPEDDYTGLGVATDENFPLKSKLQRLEETLRLLTRNANFEVKPLAYADQSVNAEYTGLNKNRYTLLNYDEDSVRMDLPVDYSNTLQNTVNGAQFVNVGYGQFTGVQAYRPAEMIYFDWAA